MDEKDCMEGHRKEWPFIVFFENEKTGAAWQELHKTIAEAKEAVSRAKNKATKYAIFDRLQIEFTHYSKDYFPKPQRQE